MYLRALAGDGLACGALLVFSTNIIVTRIAANLLDLSTGFLVSVMVNALMAGMLLAGQVIVNRALPGWNWTAFGLFLMSGVFATFLGRWLFFESIASLGAARASAFQVSSPIFVALLGAFLLGERLSAGVVLGIVTTVLGLVVLSLGERGRRTHISSAPWRLLALGLGASAAYAIGNLLRGAAIHSWNEPILGALAGALSGLVLHLVFGSGMRQFARQHFNPKEKLGLRYYAISGVLTIVGQILMIAAMEYIPVASASVITLCTPLLVLPMSHLWLRKHDAISRITWLGVMISVLGVGLVITD